ncbi:MAG: hypoxanthine phosphoribosyltransferase [Acidobacteria bacterium]|nr:hypoxanthine phosphoribosyltransferase [Acidobacteriota bacterium]
MNHAKVLYTREQIAQRVRDVAAEITRDFHDSDVVLVGILKGAAFLLTDLAREIGFPVAYELVDVTTNRGERGEVVNLTYATHFDLEGKHVLILKDVVHTGITENYLITHLSQLKPASIDLVALIDKPELRSVNLEARYALFSQTPEGYLVGYGLGSETADYVNRPELCLVDGDTT